MALPRLMEFIETIVRPGGGFATGHGGHQTIVPFFPPARTASHSVVPGEGTYALIAYKTIFGSNMVPSAFTGTIQHAGRHYYTGTLTASVIDNGLEYYMVITYEHPLMVSITNISGLNQYFEEISEFVPVSNKETYDAIVGALDKLANKGMSELLGQGIDLLHVMQTQRPSGASY